MTALGWIFFALEKAWGSVWPQWLVAGIGFVLIYGIFRRFFARRKIQNTRRWDWRQFGYEVFFSALMLGIANFIGVAVRFLVDGGSASLVDGWHDRLAVCGLFRAF